MADPDLRMSDFAAAERNSRGPRRLWILTGKLAPDDEEGVHMLVFAVCEAQACALAVACAWDDEPLEWTATEADLGSGINVIRPKDYGDTGRYIGAWHAPDAFMAELGFIPSEDWRECGCCGRVVHVDGWQDDGDDCDDCELAARGTRAT